MFDTVISMLRRFDELKSATAISGEWKVSIYEIDGERNITFTCPAPKKEAESERSD